MNLMMLLEMAASGFGDRVAVTNGEDSLTYTELYAAAGAAAAEITASGAERVALLDVNSLAVPVALFASAWAGLPFAPLNYRLTGDELEKLLGRIAPSYLIAEPGRVDALEGVPGTTVVASDAFLEHARSGADVAPPWPMEPELTAVLLFTSGTTGEPKAAVLRHKHLVSYILGSVEFMGAAETDANLVSVPPYHIAGMASIASSVYAGRRIVQLANFSAEGWVDTARSEAVTNAMVVPTMLVRIIDHLESEADAGLPSVRAISYGGGKMPLPVIEKAMEILPHVDFTNAYGLTETSSTISVLTPADHREAASSADPEVRRRLGSLGTPLPSVQVEIRGPGGEVLGPGETGEIHVKGEQVSGEYEGLGSRLDADGWFPTRDAGFVDSGGYLFLDGRIDDVIVRGGENISPGEVEAVIVEHDAVADCAVVGVPDEQWGEAVAAVVVPRAGRTVSAEEIHDWVRDRLRSSRAPVRVEVREELPYNETGKLLRRLVRADLVGES
ncbi:MAG: class I adenylate-forming enzyme family protein [Acidimicrobiia bacterium]